MNRLKSLALTMGLIVGHALYAQSPGQVTAQPGNLAGILFASSFGQWQVPQGNQGQYGWSSAAVCTRDADGFYLNPVFSVGTPITIVDNNPAHTETVTPTAVSVTGSGCSITIHPTYQHLSYYIKSGTAGYQEAINYAKNLPYQVVVSPDWIRLGGTDAMLPAGINGNNVGVVDWRTNCPVPYSWNGSGFTAGASWCGGGGGSGPSIQTNNVPNLSQSLLNFITPPVFNGLTFAFSNPSGGIETLNISGTLNNSGLTNSSTTVNGQNCVLGGSCSVTIPGGQVAFKHDGTTLTGQFAANPQIYDYDETSPAADAKFLNATFRANTTTGKWNVEIPEALPPQIEMQVIPPVSGQFVILYPSTNSGASGILSVDNGDWGCEISGAGGFIVSGQCTRTLSAPWVTVDGKTLAQLGVPTSSVTAVYPFAISSFDPGYFSDGSGVATIVGFDCGGVTLINSNFQTAQTSGLSGLSGSGIAGATCVETIGRNSSILTTSTASNLFVYSVGLVVYYTGTPALVPNALKITYGLAYNPETNVLTTDPSYPTRQVGININQLPGATSVPPGSNYAVLDAISPLDCSTGGAVYPNNFPHTCVNEAGFWVAPGTFTGLLQSTAGVCPNSVNGQLTNVNCNFGGAISNAPTEVQSGPFAGIGPCSATATLTAGNALMVSLQFPNSPPTDSAGDTFTQLWNINTNESTGYLATNIAGGSTTISAPGVCSGTFTELANVATSSPVDGTVLTHAATVIPAFYTIGPYTTTLPDDLIFTSDFANGCSNVANGPATLGYKALANGTLFTVGNTVSSLGAATGVGIYQAIWTPAASCSGTRHNNYAMVALKSANSGGGGGGSLSLTSPGSTLTLTPSTITGTGTLDLNLAHANTWSATQTFSNVKDTGAAAGSGTACLQIDTTGLITNTGLACGSGGGGGTTIKVNSGSGLTTANFNLTTPAAGAGNQNLAFQVDGSGNISVEAPIGTSSIFGIYKIDGSSITAPGGVLQANLGGVSGSGTTNFLPKWTSSTALSNSALSDASSVLTATEPLVINGGANPSQLGFIYGGTPTVGSSTEAVFGADPSGHAVMSEAGGAFSRICDAANGVCTSTSGVTSIDTLTGAFTFSGSVSHIGNAYTFTAGSGALPSGVPGQIPTISTAPNTYSVQPAVYYSQPGDTLATISGKCVNATYILTNTVNITTGGNLPSTCSVDMRQNGIFNISSGQVLNFQTPVNGTVSQHFTGSGTVSFVFSPNNPNVSYQDAWVRWWGALPDNSTDAAAAIQACIAADPHNCLLESGTYITTSATLTISRFQPGLGLLGQDTNQGTTFIKTASASNDIIDVVGACPAAPASGNSLRRIDLIRTVLPTGTAKGISTTCTDDMTIDTMGSQESIDLLWISGFTNGHYGRIRNFEGGFGYFVGGYTTQTLGGIVVDTTSNSNGSLYIDHSQIASNGLSTVNSTGYMITGPHNADFFCATCSTTQMAYGAQVIDTAGGGFHNDDMHFSPDSIFDSSYISCAKLTNNILTDTSAITFLGGKCDLTGSGPGVDIHNSTGVTVGFMQFQSVSGNTSTAINADDSSDLNIIGNRINQNGGGNQGQAIVLNNTTTSAVTSNTITSHGNNSPTLISLTGGSTGNSITGNPLNGTSSIGLSFDSTSGPNTALNNSFGSSISTQVVDSTTAKLNTYNDSTGLHVGGGTGPHGVLPTPQHFAALSACTASTVGWYVIDDTTSTTWGATVTSGTGTTATPYATLFCDGANYTVMGK